jgi:Mg2+ and Co2+ transporter CorA
MTVAASSVRVRKFDADRRDEVITLDEALSTEPTERQLLWIDIGAELDHAEVERIAEAFELDATTRQTLETPGEKPHMALHGGYLHVRVAAEPTDGRLADTPWLDVLAGRNVVISYHHVPIEFFEELNERIAVTTSFGSLDAATFMVSILDDAVTSYFRAIDAIEDEVDRLDARSLRDDGRRVLLDDLVVVRRRIARLRRVLTDHRQVFAALGSPEVAKLTDNPDSGPAFQALAARFESALASVEASRDVLLGSFEVYMTRTAQRTNDVMKVLALATVLLLPGSLAAGLLGMNVVVPLSKDDPLSFWIVVGGVAIFAVFILVVARLRRWL